MNSEIKVSVVIVSYNCLPFLTLCIDSLLWYEDNRVEIIVVDNNSNDNTAEYLNKNYPKVKTIANKDNKGFGAACNQGISIANGDYLLMLNPDTIVSETLIDDILFFMENHKNCGGMGVYMADGKGNFLPESKRGFPTIFRSFNRFSGLINIFPKNRQFAGYYLGHLSKNEINKIEVLSGAFMLFTKEVAEKTKGFDERFFMYGEDIDLSWRILKNGFENYYNPNIKIIHFKGESSVKDKVYLKNFFGAMELFHKIHFTKKRDKILRPIVNFFMKIISTLKRIELNFSKKKSHKENSYDFPITVISNNHGTIFENIETKFAYPTDNVKNNSTVWIDLANLRPSEAINFAINNNDKNLNFIWYNSKTKQLIQALSSNENSIIQHICI